MSCGKEIKCEACRAFYHFFVMHMIESLINSIIHKHDCRIYLSNDTEYFLNHVFWRKDVKTLSYILDFVMDAIT